MSYLALHHTTQYFNRSQLPRPDMLLQFHISYIALYVAIAIGCQLHRRDVSSIFISCQ